MGQQHAQTPVQCASFVSHLGLKLLNQVHDVHFAERAGLQQACLLLEPGEPVGLIGCDGAHPVTLG
jgi:hypothetical protein